MHRRWSSLAALGISLLGLPAAAEDKPHLEVTDDGRIVARMLLDAPERLVRDTIPSLQDATLSSSVLELRVTSEGTCRQIARKTRGLWSPLEMTTRMCPTPEGWREWLVDSEDYDAYTVEWTVTPREGRTFVELAVRSDVNLAVPEVMMRRAKMNGVEETFLALIEKLLGAGKGKAD